MSTFNFPNNPTAGQTYTAPNNVVYTWDGVKWKANTKFNTVATPPQFDNDESIATTAFTQRALGNYQDIYQALDSTTLELSKSDAGSLVYCSTSDTNSVALPDGIGMAPGASFTVSRTPGGTASVSSVFQPILGDDDRINDFTINGNETTYVFTAQGGDTATFTWTGSAWASSVDGAGFTQAGTGAVSRTAQDKMRETVSVKDFGAVGDGVTDDTAAIQAASQSLTGSQTLYFPDGTYLISYIWTPHSDSDSVNGIGRGKGVCAFTNKPNIRLYGPRATIKCVNHDITTYGGFTFAWVTKSPGFTIEGFNFDMTFTGYNTSASYYPMCGGVMCYDKYAGLGTQDALCSNFTARDLTFKLYHPNGAFGITSNPYGSDNNNGFKIISVFASGDSAATTYSEQSRSLIVQGIKFLKGHNGYGCWGVAYNNATFKNITADAWVASSYTIATATYTGTNFVAPVRFYQYACDGLTVDNIAVLSLPWSERTGAFQGRCGGVSVESGLTDRLSGGGSVTNCTFVLDDDNSSLGSSFDVGIKSSLSGHIRIAENSFHAWSDRAAVCVFAEGSDGTGKSDYSITGNIVSKNLCGPFVQVVNINNTSDANRIIKSMTITGNIVKGWGGEGAVYGYRTGATYYGIEHVVVANNVFDGTDSTAGSFGTAVDVRGRTSSDNIIVSQNVIKGAATPVQLGSSNKIITDNVYLSNGGNGTFGNYLTNSSDTLATFSAGQDVRMSIATGYYNQYHYIEYTSTGGIATILAGVANSGTGIIRTVAADNTGKLIYRTIANIK